MPRVFEHVQCWGCVCVWCRIFFSEQLSLCFSGLLSALNFNDTTIKIGADVSQFAESQAEESEKSRVSKIECTLAAERSLKLCVYLQQCNTRDELDLLKRYKMKEKMSFNMKNKQTLRQTEKWLMDRFADDEIISETYGLT